MQAGMLSRPRLQVGAAEQHGSGGWRLDFYRHWLGALR
jgi:hypothetical protein